MLLAIVGRTLVTAHQHRLVHSVLAAAAAAAAAAACCASVSAAPVHFTRVEQTERIYDIDI